MEKRRKKKTSISINSELHFLFCKRFKSAQFNFSSAIEGVMLAAIKDPRPYWKAQKQINYNHYQHACSVLKALNEIEAEEKEATEAKEAREEVMFR